MQRWICTKCDTSGKTYEHDPRKTKLQALALLARRLPLDQTEYLVGIKSESIRKHLMSVTADPERWAETRHGLLGLGITDRELDYLFSVTEIAALTNRCSAGPGLRWDEAEWRRRIEPILGCRIVIGTSRQGVRVCREQDFTEFIQRMRGLPFDRLATAKCLSPTELNVLRQLHSPNAQARLLSRLQAPAIEVDAATRRPLPSKLTLKFLAGGLNMDFGAFTGTAVVVVRKLRRLTSTDEAANPPAKSR